MQPKLSVFDACQMASTATTWTFPNAATPGSTGANGDSRALIVGRWVPCGPTSFRGVFNAVIELGANGRWLLLTFDETGAIGPMPPGSSNVVGRYYALGTGQIDVTDEGVGGGIFISFLQFAGSLDIMRFNNSDPSGAMSGVYARAVPSPANGRANIPSTADGRCSMVGTWEVPANTVTPVEPAASLSFDSYGNFVGGPQGSNLCASHTMYGTYRLSPGLFQLTSNVGMGLCTWWLDAGYPATFDQDCKHVMLTQFYDNCTGGRGYLNGQTTLTRRQ
jgi:hypothetical protein